MFYSILSVVFTDGLWLLIAAGWIILITIGLEVDKPMSGGIPGHVNPDDEHAAVAQEGLWGRIGTVGSWITFSLIFAALPVVTYWILVVHPR